MVLKAILKPGACFGEYALMTSDRRSATITALSKVYVAVLVKKDYDESVAYFCEQKMEMSLAALRK
jgi:CRP-like cAMP-binding protein